MALDLVVLLNVRTCFTSLSLLNSLASSPFLLHAIKEMRAKKNMTETRISLFANCGGISCIVQMLPLPDNDQNTQRLSSL